MTISSTNRKAGPFIGAGTVSTFPFAFKVFQPSDMLVVKVQVSTNIETTLTLTTDYSVVLNADQNSSPGGNIVLTSPLATGYNMVISSQVAYTQQTDLTNQGGFYPEVITNALDRLTIEVQQLDEGLSRAAQLPITSAADAAALVADIERIASSADNLDTVATNIGSVNTVASNITNVNAVGSNIANVNAVAANATNINAVNANATNINAVNANKTNIDTVAGNNANVTTVAGISANVTTVAGIAANVTSVAGNATNINAVAGNATNINAVNANSANINAVAGNATNINTVSSNTTNINTTVANMAAIVDAPNQAAAAANSAAAAAASAASGMYSSVQDKSANYTVVAGDAGDLLRINTSGGARTITLPAISTVGDGFKVAIVKWTSDANAVVVARSGSDTINGATSYTLGNQYSSATFVADLETAQWFAVASGLGVSNTAVDVFSGNGSTVAFTLSGDPGSKNNTMVEISGVYQAKATYSISGTTLTFSTAPPAGTSNIEVVWTAPLAIGVPSDGTVTTLKMADSSVTLAKIADGALAATTAGLAKMADLFVTTAKLADAAVTRAKASDGVVGGWKGVTALTANTTLTAADAGKYIAISAASLSIQINISTLSVGDRFHFNGNGGSCTLTRTDGGNFVSYGNLTTASLSVTDGNGISMFWDGANFIIENSSLNLERQTWTDVTASRALATSYTNTTGKPLFVAVSLYSGATSGNKKINFYVNGAYVLVNGNYGTTGNVYPSGMIVVPAGATYSVDSAGSNVAIGLDIWRELR